MCVSEPDMDEMWERAPECVREKWKREELQEALLKGWKAKRYLACTHCKVHAGENCILSARASADNPEWYAKWDSHYARLVDWEYLSELERAMYEAADTE